MNKMWKAVLLVNVPTGFKKTDGTPSTTQRVMTVIVPDAGGFYNTKALLEGSYGSGTVSALLEHDPRYA